MPLPKEISFTLEGEPRLLPDPTAPPPAADAPPRPVFGPEFAGTFVLRWPTARDRQELGIGLTAYFQRMGVADIAGVPGMTYGIAASVAFFERLAKEKPAWFSLDAPDSADLELAILRAHQIAEEKLAAEKKSSTPVSPI